MGLSRRGNYTVATLCDNDVTDDPCLSEIETEWAAQWEPTIPETATSHSLKIAILRLPAQVEVLSK
jgi:hypothetical protein